jgi:hypothetical protein
LDRQAGSGELTPAGEVLFGFNYKGAGRKRLLSSLQSNDDGDIEQVEANGRDNEQVHGGGVGRMVTQEGAPTRGGQSASLDHILRDAGLSDLKAELEQLAMDARRPPQRIFRAHLPDQRAHIRGDLRPASKRTRVSGQMIVMTFRTNGNHRYSWTKKKRSPFVNWTRPRTLRRNRSADVGAPRSLPQVGSST